MKWVLVLMVIGSSGDIALSISPHKFDTRIECVTFVAALRIEHESKRIDASCIGVSDKEADNQ